MGLLGEDWADPQSQGLLALAGGLLQGKFGQGVSDMNQVMMTAPARQLEILKLQQAVRQGQITNDVYQKALTGMSGQPAPYGAATQGALPGQAGSGTFDPRNPSFTAGPQSGGQPAGGTFGLNNNQLLGGMLGGPAEFGKAILAANATPEGVRTNDILGIDRGTQRSNVLNAATKAGYIPPTPLRTQVYTTPDGKIHFVLHRARRVGKARTRIQARANNVRQGALTWTYSDQSRARLSVDYWAMKASSKPKPSKTK